MALFKRNTMPISRADDLSKGTVRQLRARSKYLAHLAAAQGYRAAAGADGMLTHSRGYLQRHPRASIGIVAALAGLIGLGIYSRKRL